MATILIGLDDTDEATSPGTGRLARRLAACCAERGLRPLGVTRHQFLLDRRIPYTSHNSGACVAVESPDGAEACAFAMEFVASGSADGSDPGVCIAAAGYVGEEAVRFGWRATRDVVRMDEALAVARRRGLRLEPLGGTGLGVIGALASVALRDDGNEGRFIDLPGLRDLPARIRLGDLERMGIRPRRRVWPKTPPARQCDECDSLGWVRPRLIRGRAVLPVEWSVRHEAWIPVDRSKSRPVE